MGGGDAQGGFSFGSAPGFGFGGSGGSAPSAAAAPGAAASEQVSGAIKQVLQAKGGVYAQYSCKSVSWDDASRGQSTGGGLSCFGSNITDTYLKAKDGTRLFTVRSDNWNEKLGSVSAKDVAVIAGNTEPDSGPGLAPALLEDVLAQMGSKYGSYAGVAEGTNLSVPALDDQVSIRFQTTFIPVRGGSSGRGKLEFATEAYNYNTHSDEDPRNLVVLCTTQGIAVQQDGRGKKQIFHHSVQPRGAGGFSSSAARPVARHWLEAESSAHKVGGAQLETEAERADALARGKATSAVIGTRAMGTRFNVLMTIQVPLQQRQRKAPTLGGGFGFGAGTKPPSGGFGFGAGTKPLPSGFGGSGGPSLAFGSFGAASAPVPGCNANLPPPHLPPAWSSGPTPAFGSAAASGSAVCFGSSSGSGQTAFKPKVGAPPSCWGDQGLRMAAAPAAPVVGTASAARVSLGSKHDDWGGLAVKGRLERHASERVTVTVVIYNAVEGGVPSEADVLAAIDDMEQLYASCAGGSGRLADAQFNVFKNGGQKSSSSAHPLLPPPVANASTFPAATSGPLPYPASFQLFAGAPNMFGGSTFGAPPPPAVRVHADAPAALREFLENGKVGVSDAGWRYIHDAVGLPWLAAGVGGGRLCEAFHAFRVANEVQVSLTGGAAPTALYNLACCVAVAARDDPTGVLRSSGMLGESAKKEAGSSSEALRNRGLETSLRWLHQALGAGYNNAEHVNADPDLSALRAKYGAL